MSVRREPKRPLRIVLATPRGFCAGVERAIEIVERALERFGSPIYVRHEIVHNKYVVESLRAKGVRFVDELDEIPPGAVAIFSAHGVSRRVQEEGIARQLDVIDATCPLVTKVHDEGRRYSEKGFEIVLIGHMGHPEVEGTMGQIPGRVSLVTCVEDAERFEPQDPDKLAYVTQTTLSVDDTREIIATLRRRFPFIAGPDVRDICYATQNRQTAVREIAQQVDVVLVVGSQNSSNSNRLCEIGQASVPSYLVEDANTLRAEWLENASSVGITAGASAPESLVEGLLLRLEKMFDIQVETQRSTEEHVQFQLPPQLVR